MECGDPKCVWENEVLAVATDGSGQVWRFAHHRSTVPRRGLAASAEKYNLWDSPRGTASPDGRFYMFTSNWEETLGQDRNGRFRQDVFIVKLAADADRRTAGR